MATTEETIRFRLGLAASAAILGALALPMVWGQVYHGNDLGLFHLPLRHFYARCLASGDDFAWFPGIYCGFDLLGEGQVGLYHPLHLALYSALPFGVAFNLEFLASYVALLGGTYVFLRRWDLPRDASALGAMIFAFGGYAVGHSMHINSVAIIAHLPWLLAAIDVAIRESDARKAAWGRLGVGLLTTSQLLLGHPQSVWFSGLVEALYVLSLVASPAPGIARLAALAWAKGLGVLGGAIQLLPTFEAVNRSQRETLTPALKALGSLPPANLLQWLAPYLYASRVVAPPTRVGDILFGPATSLGDFRAYEFGLYNGAMVPVLLTWLWLRRREFVRGRRLAIGAAVLAALALVLAFGKYTPLFRYTSRLPVLGVFRIPSRYLVLFHLATATLAAVALADLASLKGRLSWRSLRPLLALPALSLLVAVGAKALARPWPQAMLRPVLAPNSQIAAGVVLVGVATLLVLLAARGRRVALAAILLFAAADEAIYGLTLVRFVPPAPLESLVEARPAPPIGAGDRVRMFDNLLTLRGARLVEGYAALVPKRELDYRKPACLRLSGASWSVPGPDLICWTPVPDPLPRARLVARAIPYPTPNTIIDGIDLRTTALVPRALRLEDGTPGEARILSDRPGRVHIVTNAVSRQLLILAERAQDGWNVLVDGKKRRVVRVNGDFLGCVVDPGKHRVTFRYQPWARTLGGRLTLLAMVLMGASVTASLITSKRAAVIVSSGADRGAEG